MILMLSMLTGTRLACTTSNKTTVACGKHLCSLPWSMVWIGTLNAFAYLMFVSPEVVLAVTGQVVMGTMYVLLQQGSSELVEWCSRGGKASGGDEDSEHHSYQNYAAMADACFSCCGCLGSILPYLVLDKLSAEWVCYIAAGVQAAYPVAFVLVFLCRSCGPKRAQEADRPKATCRSTVGRDIDTFTVQI